MSHRNNKTPRFKQNVSQNLNNYQEIVQLESLHFYSYTWIQFVNFHLKFSISKHQISRKWTQILDLLFSYLLQSVVARCNPFSLKMKIPASFHRRRTPFLEADEIWPSIASSLSNREISPIKNTEIPEKSMTFADNLNHRPQKRRNSIGIREIGEKNKILDHHLN